MQMPPWKRGRISQFMTVTSSRKYILAWVGRLSDEITSLQQDPILVNHRGIINRLQYLHSQLRSSQEISFSVVQKTRWKNPTASSTTVSRALEGSLNHSGNCLIVTQCCVTELVKETFLSLITQKIQGFRGHKTGLYTA